MKKFLTAAVVLCLIAGCTGRNTDDTETSEEPVPAERPLRVWMQNPDMTIDGVKMMEPFARREIVYNSPAHGIQYVLADMERVGYPQEWNDSGYDTDGIIVEKDGNHGIFDFNGNILYPTTVNVHQAPFASGIAPARIVSADGNVRFGWGTVNTAAQTAILFDPILTTVSDIPVSEYQYDPYHEINKWPYFAVQNDIFGVVTPLLTPEGKMTYEYDFEQWQGGQLPGNLIVPVVDNNFNRIDYMVCDSYGNAVMHTIVARGSYVENTYVNGYYLIGMDNEVTIIHAMTGSQVGASYFGAKYFSDGYMPVKKYGKWGFIDENGDEVTDFIFDDVTPVVHGKSYVRHNGKFGVLNIKEYRDKGKQVTWSECYGEKTQDPVIGSITVNVSELNIREGASIYGTSVGNAAPGSRYDIYEQTDAEGYTWYRIDESHWIPDSGEWLTVELNNS